MGPGSYNPTSYTLRRVPAPDFERAVGRDGKAGGVTPLPKVAWLPLRAFVDYKAFETMMIDGL